ncbi:MotA/TolQ/ExbB proton channel family protein [Cognatishimia sp.]|uniref:MotA/TolQ/ExbB proton channel family protein n=1 Tax=Cognatishimia sp. TaxID=2211648 RepID=UPI0035170973|nr:MotA/TolQ/ExbB proton channel family protein [Cognatishimia sp.]
MVDALRQIAELGGPVVLMLLVISVLTATVVLLKLWQMRVAHVGQHRALKTALELWDMGDIAGAKAQVSRSRSYLKQLVSMAMQDGSDSDRLHAEAETRFARLEGGFRFLDTVSQLSPLLGLFGTVLGMISAFQALQDAGAQVDPQILAGGIWVALMTTAVGLAVAMPTSLVLSWFEGRMDAERVFAERALQTILNPSRDNSAEMVQTRNAA